MNRLLDTDTCIGVLRRKAGLAQRLSQFFPGDCAISTVTVYEVFAGVRKSSDPAKERQKVERFLSIMPQLVFDQVAAEKSAEVRSDLEQQGQIIGPYDLLIAGQALTSGLTLVTGNVREFGRVSSLKLETW